MKIQILSLPVGGAYETTEIQEYTGAALRNFL